MCLVMYSSRLVLVATPDSPAEIDGTKFSETTEPVTLAHRGKDRSSGDDSRVKDERNGLLPEHGY